MLIDAVHPEETRVAVVADGQIEDFDFEARDKRQLRGNIYLAKVTRVEPSLQAAFVEYGGNRHGFLAFSEIHPDYYQIPKEDREALLREEAESAYSDDDDDDDDDHAHDDEPSEDTSDHDDQDSDDETEESEANDESDEDESETDDAVSERPRRRSRPQRRYKIQEVIKRRQVLLIQVVKEERGNKGAAVTTYLSLAGRYGVLMPNTARGGGISRKITNASDRKRLKKITQDFDVPEGMGLIIRTAGAKRTKAEVSRDYDYLMRLWTRIRERTLDSVAPCLIHEEGDLVLRAVRDLYDPDIDRIIVEGDDAHREVASVVDMLMPDQSDIVEHHEKNTPLFIAHGVEPQLDSIFSPVVTLPSGGYIVINQTEALVAIDVNSGKATRERNIETTAVKTNLEAGEEACRQMRLRDLAGLLVIDFIDMEENKNNRAVEKKMKECLSYDRARVQAGRISQFGLFEISRQRRRAGVLELSSEPCSACTGTGRTRSIESAALQLIRAIGERAADTRVDMIEAQAPAEVAMYILNHKRGAITELEESANVAIRIQADDSIMPGDFVIDATSNGKTVPYKPVLPQPSPKRRRRRPEQDDNRDNRDGLDVIDSDEDDEEAGQSSSDDDDSDDSRRRRRGRRGGRRRRGAEEGSAEAEETQEGGRGRRPRRRRPRRRTPDVAIDGGEMLDAIASAPFLVPEAVEIDDDQDEDAAAVQAEAPANSGEDDNGEENGARRKRRRRRKPRGSAQASETAAEADQPSTDAEVSGSDATEDASVAPVAVEIVEIAAPEADASKADEPSVADADDETEAKAGPVAVAAEPVTEPEPETVAAESDESDEDDADTASDVPTEEPELHALHGTTEPAPPPKKRRLGWWRRS